MPQFTRILLVRHGSTPFSVENRFAGASDVPLSDDGRKLARALSARLSRETIAAAYSSGMQRTTETASIVAAPHGLTVAARPGLREIDHGHWEGRVHEEVERDFAAEYAAWNADPFTVAPPGGESGLSVLARALPALQEIVAAHPGQTALVVAHKATNRLLLASLLGFDPRNYRQRLAQDLACLNILDFENPRTARLQLMNDTSHYPTTERP